VSQFTSPFARMLHDERRRQGLSQAALARSIDINHATLSRLESGERRPSRVMAMRIANGLGIDGEERVQFLAAAGYTTTGIERDPTVTDLIEILNRPDIPLALRLQLREGVEKLIEIVTAALALQPAA